MLQKFQIYGVLFELKKKKKKKSRLAHLKECSTK